MSLPNPAELLPRMASDLRAHLAERGIERPRFVGIHTGGIWVAEALLRNWATKSRWAPSTSPSTATTSLQNGLHPQVRPSALPFEIDGQHLVLVDDVLMSGRTIRAALNELFDYGRPASVTLVCLLDLNARELPIRPDVVGQTLSLGRDERVKLVGPAPLALERKVLSSAS